MSVRSLRRGFESSHPHVKVVTRSIAAGTVTLLLGFVLAVALPSPRARSQAVPPIGIPLDALVGAGASLTTGTTATTAITSYIAGEALVGAPAYAIGGGASGTATVGGAAVCAGVVVCGVSLLGIAAAGTMSYHSTYRFLEWVSNDSRDLPGTPATASELTTTENLSADNCTFPSSWSAQPTYGPRCGTFGWSAAAFGGYSPVGDVFNLAQKANGTTFAGGVSVPNLAADVRYPSDSWNGSWESSTLLWTASSNAPCQITANSAQCAYNPAGAHKAGWIGLATSCRDNLGGVCGLRPGLVFTVAKYNGPSGGWEPRAFWSVSPKANARGWQREIVGRVACKYANGTYTYHQQVSSPFWDNDAVKPRASVPSCPVGGRATKWQIHRRPTGTWNGDIQTPSTYELPIAVWNAPTAMAPAADACLRVGSSCGTPTVDNGQCLWGPNVVPASWCDPARQLKPGDPIAPTVTDTPNQNPVTTTTLVGATVPPSTAPPSAAAATCTVGSPCEVTADAGTPNVGPAPEGTEGEKGAECWTHAGLRLSPKTWVPALLRGVTCTLGYLFVPKHVDETLASTKEKFDDSLPGILIGILKDTFDGLVFGLPDDDSGGPSGNGCEGPRFSFFDDDFVLTPFNICTGSPQRLYVMSARAMLGFLVSWKTFFRILRLALWSLGISDTLFKDERLDAERRQEQGGLF